MHGLGADARDFYGIPPELGLPPELNIRYVFPNAPRMPVTINQGSVMPAWYDIRGFGARDQDETGIRGSAERIRQLIAREVERGVPERRIVLAGFSQGGAMALFTGLRHPAALAGVMCLSGYLVLYETLEAEASEANRGVPIFQGHGTEDPMVPAGLAQGTRDLLTGNGYLVEYHEYPMAHTLCLQEVRDIGTWLARVLASHD